MNLNISGKAKQLWVSTLVKCYLDFKFAFWIHATSDLQKESVQSFISQSQRTNMMLMHNQTLWVEIESKEIRVVPLGQAKAQHPNKFI